MISLTMQHLLKVIFILFLGFSEQTSEWTYHNNAQDWVYLGYAECGFSSQSPIDIITNQETQNCGDPLLLHWTSKNQNFVVGNNGHSLQAVPFVIDRTYGSHLTGIQILNHNNDTNIRLTNPFYNTFKSRVNSEYCFDSVHFHWSDTDDYGSEHAINNKYYPLEAHLVHFSCDYYSNTDAQNAYSSGKLLQDSDDDNILAVVSILFEIGEEGNTVLDAILNDIIIDEIYEFETETDAHLIKLLYTEFDLMDLLPKNKQVIAYSGSLTTPPCFETVRWNIMKNTMVVSLDQLNHFRRLLRSTNINDTIAPNWRPLQALNNRTIYECQQTIDQQRVDKEPETVVQVDHMIEECKEIETQLIVWFVIGIVFMCLFVVALLVIYFMAYHLYGDNQQQKQIDKKGPYEKAGTNETIEMTKYS